MTGALLVLPGWPGVSRSRPDTIMGMTSAAPQASIDLRFGDCLDVMRTLDDASIDAVVTDPPYGLEFMGRNWDGQVPGVTYWRECLRVAKPGAYLAAFGGTRTYHRLAVAIEDAGWQIQDSIGMPLLAWVQGQGFPKSKSQLKPAWEPIVLARKPFKGSSAANVLAHGTGVLNIAATRTGGDQGRWPTNVLLAHDAGCDEGGACAELCPVAGMDRQSLANGMHGAGRARTGTEAVISGQYAASSYQLPPNRRMHRFGDSGGASRFFPIFRYQAKASNRERPKIDGKGWPTVKPRSLMAWIARLACPPGGVILDPFAGTGPTLQAAHDEGFASIGIERDEFAYRLARQRLGLPELVEQGPARAQLGGLRAMVRVDPIPVA